AHRGHADHGRALARRDRTRPLSKSLGPARRSSRGSFPVVAGGRAVIRGLVRRAIRRALLTPPPPEPQPRPADVPSRLTDGLRLAGYLCSEIGLGQAAGILAHACDAQRLPLSFRRLALPGRDNEREFVTKCNTFSDRKAQLMVFGLASLDRFEHDTARGAVNI